MKGRLTKRGEKVRDILLTIGLSGMFISGMFIDGYYWWTASNVYVAFSALCFLGLYLQGFEEN